MTAGGRRMETPTGNVSGTATGTEGTCVRGGGGAQVEQVEQRQEDVFRIGALVECQTVQGPLIQGHVLCYDQPTRLLVLKQSHEDGEKRRHCEMRFVNLALVQNVAELKPPPADAQPTYAMASTVAQGQERLRRAEQHKALSLPHVHVTLVAQRLFLTIRKTLEETRWEEDRIVVMEKVCVCPPYSRDDVRPLPDLHDDHKAHSTAHHVQKIIDKHYMRMVTLNNDSMQSTPDRQTADNVSFSSETDKEDNQVEKSQQNGPGETI